MKYLSTVIIMFLFSCQTKQNDNDIKKTLIEMNNTKLEVLLIGTFHFANFNPENNSDIIQTNEVDVLTDQNQKELELISNKIVDFNPDKIFIEIPFNKQKRLDSIYDSFLARDFKNLKRNEVVQLAYRIGKKLNHKKMYAFDYRKTSFPYDDMLETMKNANQTILIEKENIDMATFESRYNEIVSSNQSVKEVLYFLNDDENRKNDLSWYLNLANMAGSINDSIGTFLASEWYRRNLYMYSTIQKQITDKDKKIMILAGASHIAVIKDFIEYNPEWKIVELKEIVEK